MRNLSLYFIFFLLHWSLQSQDTNETFDFSNFIVDCNTDFFTVTTDGVIQQWQLVGNSILGGQVILENAGASLAFCGDGIQATFYSTTSVNRKIKYYDSANNAWAVKNTSIPVINNGGHKEDQYYMNVTPDVPTSIHYYDGETFTLLDALDGWRTKGQDIAVDTLGRAWVIVVTDDSNELMQVRVYDKNGILTAYPITLNTSHIYGSFFLNGTFYVGVGETAPIFSNSIIPILIENDKAVLGTRLPFTNQSFGDMASCQNPGNIKTAVSSIIKQDFSIFPNPTNGLVQFSSTEDIIALELIHPNGQTTAVSLIGNTIDLGAYANGIYFLKIFTKKGYSYKKIIKQ